ncbi:hypothetical protein MTO96_051972 [Rhipicephalus appendiculatus]
MLLSLLKHYPLLVMYVEDSSGESFSVEKPLLDNPQVTHSRLKEVGTEEFFCQQGDTLEGKCHRNDRHSPAVLGNEPFIPQPQLHQLLASSLHDLSLRELIETEERPAILCRPVCPFEAVNIHFLSSSL